MTQLCRLCRTSTAREDCYVRLEREDHPACRACWEQLFLDPRRVLRTLRNPDQSFPTHGPLTN